MERTIAHEESGHRGAFFIAQDGKRLAEMTYSRASETHTRVMATCPYASAQFAKDPSIRDVLA